jgi:hypothetical protein
MPAGRLVATARHAGTLALVALVLAALPAGDEVCAQAPSASMPASTPASTPDSGTSAAQAAAASRVPRPSLAPPAGERCIADAAYMRRHHPELLVHQRDRTVRAGVRGTRDGLADCVGCHASPTTGRVTGSADAFCESCHRYAAVELDCFECHADRPKTAAPRVARAP